MYAKANDVADADYRVSNRHYLESDIPPIEGMRCHRKQMLCGKGLKLWGETKSEESAERKNKV
jgi:hypothetical protein